MTDNITLPRAVAKTALDHVQWFIDNEEGGRFVEEREALAALRAALAEPDDLRRRADEADAIRYRWIAENAMAIDFVADPDNLIQVWHGTDPARFSAGKTLDEAVDAARRKT